MICPCIDCRNVCHQAIDTVVEHLVIKGMDKKYMRNSCRSMHGERRADMSDSGETKAYYLLKTAYFADDCIPPPSSTNSGGDPKDCEATKESEFRQKLRDAETPLYSSCLKYTKVFAIMALYRIKVKSGMSENYFDQLLTAVHDMLPEDNVLPKITYAMKKFLKVFGIRYDVIHACKNDCILYRKKFEKIESCPRCIQQLRVTILDVYLVPLVDDLKDLWNEGIEVYDAYLKENFTLRALLLWSISDYPALGTLTGCKVKGKQACNVCGKDTPHRWLKFIRKYVYMGNKRCLRSGHPYRCRKAWFNNTVEEGTAKRIQTGYEIYEVLKDFRNDFGRPQDKESKRKRADLLEGEAGPSEEYEESTDQWRWKKWSILFDFPYWKDLLVRHNIDVMHVEKNLSDAILFTLMQSSKSKDGLKARKDLDDIGIRRHLHAEARGKRTYLPPAVYGLSKEEKFIFTQRLSKFRGPDGYCGNFANCISVKPPMIGSLKSHDHHVLIQNLLPAALRGLLPKGPTIAVNRVCNYFNRLCQRVIDPEKMISMES
ncbi:unnamed protein product [Microthlaspi erraticum]|uniref:Transposase-associated domain-containing protein n=1 Tax=Microthlaspi erraticum TaxID=1685480 RepID=A0A6D2HZ27_9BRAS|nr:unnamed protein product [Microthlaspi erraticum]